MDIPGIPRSKKNLSCQDALAKALAEATGTNIDGIEQKTYDSENFDAPNLQSKQNDTNEKIVNGDSTSFGVCPECGDKLKAGPECRGGFCYSCGYSTCG